MQQIRDLKGVKRERAIPTQQGDAVVTAEVVDYDPEARTKDGVVGEWAHLLIECHMPTGRTLTEHVAVIFTRRWGRHPVTGDPGWVFRASGHLCDENGHVEPRANPDGSYKVLFAHTVASADADLTMDNLIDSTLGRAQYLFP